MANAPLLDGDVDPRRLFLADLDGTGCADLVYVDARASTSGSTGPATPGASARPSPARRAPTTRPPWSSPTCSAPERPAWSGAGTSPGRGTSNYQALDFCGGVKPYVLVGLDNSMGATTRVSTPRPTRYFLEDRAAGNPWLTALPFPVQVVDKVETIDHVGRTKRVATYRYHHGHYDGREREFRGFGRVDAVRHRVVRGLLADRSLRRRPARQQRRSGPLRAAGGDPLAGPHRRLLRRRRRRRTRRDAVDYRDLRVLPAGV